MIERPTERLGPDGDPAGRPAAVRPGRAAGGPAGEALRRWRVLRPHREDGVPLPRTAGEAGVAVRTAQRWLTRYRAGGLTALARSSRADRGTGGCRRSCGC